ncbi:MAG: polyphosphate glucokinase [Actinomycetota bacterium]|nr:polyphosphate glucokinase [Actinomycetota bacterium]
MRTLSIDCGGSGIKGAILDPDGNLTSDRVRYRVAYPMAPADFLAVLDRLATGAGDFDRVTVGMPGMIRHGVVITTPHYITVAGPHSRVDPALAEAWSGFDVQTALTDRWQRPTVVLNDAQVQGAAVISGHGYEVMFTLGTGLGCAEFDDGVIQPKLEVSRAPVRKGVIYDEWVGAAARKRIGNGKWNRRVQQTIDGLRPMFCWDHLYLGGGEATRVKFRLQEDVTVVPNIMGIRGGARVWELRKGALTG